VAASTCSRAGALKNKIHGVLPTPVREHSVDP
jgi:hypothetical protein